MYDPLVSICVIAYNSQETILETLDSIYKQSYSNIELIVSDDCSSDNTVTLVVEWLNKHRDRFRDSCIITSDNNTGVTSNCNRALKKAKGIYIKDIAADDLLMEWYVNDCVEYFKVHPECDVLFTKIQPFIDNEERKMVNMPENYSFLELSQNEQYEKIITKGETFSLLPTPSVIYTKVILEKMNYYDEDIPMWEDGPMYFKLIQNKIKLFLLDKICVYYRLRNNSISNQVPVSHIISISKYYFKYLFPYEKKRFSIKFLYHYVKYYLGLHCNRKIPRFLFTITQLHVKSQLEKIY